MQTVKRYDEYPYDTEFTAKVVSCTVKNDRALNVVLDETLFFPEEGGQTPDRGTLAGFPVVDVQIGKDGVITHTVECTDPSAFPEGKDALGILDWEHRYSNMQNHSGEHVLSGLLHSMYGYENVGFRLSDNTVTLDTSGQLDDDQIRDLELKANEVVYRNVPITCRYPSKEELSSMEYRSKKAIDGPVRIVTIEGVDVCACCAPHVRHTGEIGLIRILSVLHTKTNMRLTIVCGRRALLYTQNEQLQAMEVSHLTNAPVEKIADGVQRFAGEIAQLKEKNRALEDKYVSLRLSQIQSGTLPEGAFAVNDAIYVFEDPMNNLSQRAFVNALCEKEYRFAGVFCGSDADSYTYIIGSRSDDARTPNQVLRQNLSARGGGKPLMVTGSVKAEKEKILDALKEVK